MGNTPSFFGAKKQKMVKYALFEKLTQALTEQRIYPFDLSHQAMLCKNSPDLIRALYHYLEEIENGGMTAASSSQENVSLATEPYKVIHRWLLHLLKAITALHSVEMASAELQKINQLVKNPACLDIPVLIAIPPVTLLMLPYLNPTLQEFLLAGAKIKVTHGQPLEGLIPDADSVCGQAIDDLSLRMTQYYQVCEFLKVDMESLFLCEWQRIELIAANINSPDGIEALNVIRAAVEHDGQPTLSRLIHLTCYQYAALINAVQRIKTTSDQKQIVALSTAAYYLCKVDMLSLNQLEEHGLGGVFLPYRIIKSMSYVFQEKIIQKLAAEKQMLDELFYTYNESLCESDEDSSLFRLMLTGVIMEHTRVMLGNILPLPKINYVPLCNRESYITVLSVIIKEYYFLITKVKEDSEELLADIASILKKDDLMPYLNRFAVAGCLGEGAALLCICANWGARFMPVVARNLLSAPEGDFIKQAQRIINHYHNMLLRYSDLEKALEGICDQTLKWDRINNILISILEAEAVKNEAALFQAEQAEIVNMETAPAHARLT